MERIKKIEIFRALAMILVVVYHAWVYSGYPNTGYNVIVAYGGEIGVTLFFIISGFAIFMSLYKTERQGKKIKYIDYIKKRFMRIAPAYYMAIFLLAIIGGQIYLVTTKSGVKDLGMHLLLIHNLDIATHGSINGAFWTLGVIFQFYLIAILIYKLMRKYPKITVITSVLITIIYKIILFNAIGNDSDPIKYFIWGRQLMGSIDNFVLGMFIAYLLVFNRQKVKQILIYPRIIAIISLGVLYLVLKSLDNNILYSNSTFSYIWHTSLAVVLSLLIIATILVEFNEDQKWFKAIYYIAKIEYGIYIWHLPILISIVNASVLSTLNSNARFYSITAIVMGISIIISRWYEKYAEEIFKDFINILRKIPISSVIYISVCVFCFINMPNYVDMGKFIIENSNRYIKDDVSRQDSLSKLVDEVSSTIGMNNESTYLYLDENDYRGTMNFWAIRYYLSPMKAIHWNTYAYNLNQANKDEVYNYLRDIDVDYVIINGGKILELLDLPYSEEGYIYKLNKEDCTDIQSMLEEVGD